MVKLYRKALLALVTLVTMCTAAKAANNAWPANYQGVMLQGFYWDSFQDTKWTNLTAQADELSKYFKLIWIPNSAKSSGNGMGYMPTYWFTNYNSAFGTQTELRDMIATYKAKGTGFIADVVINHRVGLTNWCDFPTEQWNGKTWKIGMEGICRNDECANNGYNPTGAYDTGENYDAARDLDHTNANVQENCKNYCKFLIDDLGYVGFRYDLVKGYAGKYNKMYNEYAGASFSVGENWDGNYDTVAAWIESTGKQSAAFDFPFKYAVNEAFHSNDMTKLVWMANGTTPQPAGLIHSGYSQYAVTFIDNHDTSRDGSKFNGNVAAANAFMLCSPGTPCVYLPHWKSDKQAISRLIEIRNAVGLHNNSAVKVLKSSRDCYMAEVTGTNGTLVVKIGSAQDSPAGYSAADIKTSGTNYCVWTKAGVTPTPDPDPTPGDGMTVYYDNTVTKWATPYIHYWGAAESTWPGVAMTVVEGNVWKYDLPEGTTGILFNAGNGDATKTPDFVAVNGHIYNRNGDQGVYNGGGGQPDPEPTPTDPYDVYFDNAVTGWTTPHIHYWGAAESTWPGVAMSIHKNTLWKYTVPAGTTGILFNAGDGDATKTSDFAAVAGHVYTAAGDQGHINNYGGGDDPEPVGNLPEALYVIGNLEGSYWDTTSPLPMTRQGNTMVADVTFEAGPDQTMCWFNLCTTTGADWDAVNSGDRYGAEAESTPLTKDTAAKLVKFTVNVNASACTSWTCAPGKYHVVADFANNTITLSDAAGVDDLTADDDATPAVYYNMQGVRVNNPRPGTLYIKVTGTTATKVMVR